MSHILEAILGFLNTLLRSVARGACFQKTFVIDLDSAAALASKRGAITKHWNAIAGLPARGMCGLRIRLRPISERRHYHAGPNDQARVKYIAMTDTHKPTLTGTWRETPKTVFKKLPRSESPKDFLRRMSRQPQAVGELQPPAAGQQN